LIIFSFYVLVLAGSVSNVYVHTMYIALYHFDIVLLWLLLSPPWSATLTWWWGLCPEDPNDLQSEGEELTKSRPYDKNNHTTRHQSQVAGEFSASRTVAVTFGYIGVAHWAKLIRPQRRAGIITCPPRR